MAIVLTENINILPRISNRWLKVNHYEFNGEILLPNEPFSKQFLSSSIPGNIVLKQAEKGKTTALVPLLRYGVSDELVKLGEEHANGGFTLEIPENEKLEEPLRVRYDFDAKNPVLYDHNLIIAKKGSVATIIVEYKGDEGKFFHNGVTKVFAEKGAQLTLIKVQRLSDSSIHFDSHYVDVGARGKVRYVQVELGSEQSITNYLGRIDEQSDAVVDGMYLGDGERILDLNYHMVHTGYGSNSDILVKGALKDNSKKVFRGTLDFKKGAHLADGNEEEYVLLLDPTVKSDAVPLLLSEEDDVVGGHAASAGKVDEKQLFYLMSRGLNEEEATLAIVKASYQPVIDLLPEDLRESILEDLHQRLVV